MKFCVLFIAALLVAAPASAWPINWQFTTEIQTLHQRGNNLLATDTRIAVDNYPRASLYGAGYPYGTVPPYGAYYSEYYGPYGYSYGRPQVPVPYYGLGGVQPSPFYRMAWDVEVYSPVGVPVLVTAWVNNQKWEQFIVQPGETRVIRNVPLGEFLVDYRSLDHGEWMRYADERITIAASGGRPELGGNYYARVIQAIGMPLIHEFSQGPPRRF